MSRRLSAGHVLGDDTWIKTPVAQAKASGVVCAVKHHLCAGVEPMGERQELQAILLPDEHLPRRLDQLQLLLLAPSKMRIEKPRLERCGLSSSTCGYTNPPNLFFSLLSFCAPRARDATSVLPGVREARKGFQLRYLRFSSGPSA